MRSQTIVKVTIKCQCPISQLIIKKKFSGIPIICSQIRKLVADKKKNRKRKLLVKFQCPITELKNQIEVILLIEVQDKSPERGI